MLYFVKILKMLYFVKILKLKKKIKGKLIEHSNVKMDLKALIRTILFFSSFV